MRNQLLLISLFLSSFSTGQDFQVTSILDTTQIRIGEQTTYRIIASGIEDPEMLKWPEIKDTLHRNVEVIEKLPLDTLISEAGLSLQQSIIITSWDSGYYAIKPMNLNYDGIDYVTEAMLLSVNTVQVDTTAAPLDIKPIYQEPFSLKDWLRMNWPYLAGLAAAILIAILILRLKRKGSVDVFGPAPVKLIPAHEKALSRLRGLKEKEAFNKEKKKEYYSDLTDTLRTYLEERYHVKALEQTSSEIIEGLRYVGLDARQIDYLRSLLFTADMVKFAKEQPSSVIAENHLERAFEFIQDTKLIEEEVAAEVDEEEFANLPAHE